jgi:hypothetical protein
VGIWNLKGTGTGTTSWIWRGGGAVAEAFFHSEIHRRLAVTIALIVLSRMGYFTRLPGFGRRLIPDSYMSFSSLPAGLFHSSLGLHAGELCLGFCLGI